VPLGFAAPPPLRPPPDRMEGEVTEQHSPVGPDGARSGQSPVAAASSGEAADEGGVVVGAGSDQGPAAAASSAEAADGGVSAVGAGDQEEAAEGSGAGHGGEQGAEAQDDARQEPGEQSAEVDGGGGGEGGVASPGGHTVGASADADDCRDATAEAGRSNDAGCEIESEADITPHDVAESGGECAGNDDPGEVPFGAGNGVEAGTEGASPSEIGTAAAMGGEDCIGGTAASAGPAAACAAGPGEAGHPGAPASEVDHDEVPGVDHVEVPGAQIDVPAQVMPASSTCGVPFEAITEQLQATVRGALANFGERLSEVPEEELRSALQDWASRFQGHLQELQAILEHKRSATAEADACTGSTRGTDIAECEGSEEPRVDGHPAGSEAGDSGGLCDNAEETAREVAELRRVRRQIRCIFGDIISGLPDTSSLRLEELMSDGEDKEEDEAGPASARSAQRGGASDAPPRVDAVLPAPPASKVRPPRVPSAHDLRHCSRSADMPSTTNSSWASRGASDEPRREHRERKHRRHRRQQDTSPEMAIAREPKRDDGAAAKQWNWAEQMVRASLDPQNQWEFPGAKLPQGSGRHKSSLVMPPPQMMHPGDLWEQPRGAAMGHRGKDIAARARERAEEVQRHERKQERRTLGIPAH